MKTLNRKVALDQGELEAPGYLLPKSDQLPLSDVHLKGDGFKKQLNLKIVANYYSSGHAQYLVTDLPSLFSPGVHPVPKQHSELVEMELFLVSVCVLRHFSHLTSALLIF